MGVRPLAGAAKVDGAPAEEVGGEGAHSYKTESLIPEAYFFASGISVTIVWRSIGKYFLIASWMFC